MRKEPIAIVGIGCRFPGNASDPEAFWKLLCDGVDTVTEIPLERWDWRGYYDPEPGKPGKTYVRSAGLIDAIDRFDPEFFGISRREAPYIDPQQRLLLEVTWEAFEDAGQPIDANVARTGVFVGISTNDYALIQPGPGDIGDVDTYSATGGTASIAANRISYCFNFRGPSIAVDTACSSSLVAVHLACRALWNGDCDTAVAGGVNCIISPAPFIAFCGMSMLSPDGRCKTFDEAANGFVRGEGAGAVLLKPLAKALSDRDSIYAVIRGTAVNQDGRTSSLTVPSRESQELLVREACRNAGVRPQDIQYVETHGTGTPVGDPIEANALGSVLSYGRQPGDTCLIGSVKTNIGHLEAGAGIAGLIKTALCLKHGRVPPNLHFSKPNPLIDFDRLQLQVPQTSIALNTSGDPAVAGVNSFGFGGTNAHVILEGVPPPRHSSEQAARHPVLLPLSSRNAPTGLQAVAHTYREYLSPGGKGSFSPPLAICRSAALRRNHHDFRIAVIGQTHAELVERLNAFSAGEAVAGLCTGRTGDLEASPYRDRPSGEPRKLVFVFSGQGPQWWAMGRELLDTEEVFRRKIEDCHAALRALGCEWSLLDELRRAETETQLAETEIAQPAIFALQVALAALWESWGIRPDAVVGHSVGEVAAAHVAGIYDLAAAALVIYQRARAMRRAGSGKMIAASLKCEEAAELVAAWGPAASIAAVNAPRSVSISGDTKTVDEIAGSLEQRAVHVRYVPVNYAFHSAHMDVVRDELLESLIGLRPRRAMLPMYSTVTGVAMSGAELDAGYWWRNVRDTVRFSAAIGRLIEDGYRHFVEISSHPVLSNSVRECLAAANVQGTALPSLRRGNPDSESMLESLGMLYVSGYTVNWQALYRGEEQFPRLPLYAWQKERFWNESARSRERRLNAPAHPLLNRRIESADPSWETQLDSRVLTYLPDHRAGRVTLFPASGYVEMTIAAASRIFDATPFVIEDLEIPHACTIPADEKPLLQFTYYQDGATFSIRSRLSASSHWTDHANGRCRADSERVSPQKKRADEIRARCSREIAPAAFYEIAAKAGLGYGPQFRGMQQAWVGEDEALGLIELDPSARGSSPFYFFHPAFLDSCFQVIATLPLRGTLLPVRMKRIRFYEKPARQAWSHVRLKRYVPQKLVEAEISVFDESGHILIEIDDFCCRSAGAVGFTKTDPLSDCVYELQWMSKPLEQSARENYADVMPDAVQLGRQLESRIPSFRDSFAHRRRYDEFEPEMDRLCRASLIRAFAELGWTPERGEMVTVQLLLDRMRIQPKYERLLRRLLDQLTDDGVLENDHSGWRVRRRTRATDTRRLWRRILYRFPGYSPELTLLERCNLAAALRGDSDPLQMMFPSGSLDTLEHLYGKDVHNHVIAAALDEILARGSENRTLRILEIGAGTGAMTASVLRKLNGRRAEYVFTDVSQLFIAKAEKRFAGYPFVRFQLLDIEKPPAAQGFEPHTFDVILASDVLHATADLPRTLGYVRELFAPNGLLAIMELERTPRFCDVTFGLTDGWWRFQDFRTRKGHPILDRNEWKELLEFSGFHHFFAVSDSEDKGASGQVTLLAMAPDPGAKAKSPTPASDCSGAWLLLADRTGTAGTLASQLQSAGAVCVLIHGGEKFRKLSETEFEIDPASPADLRNMLDIHDSWRGIIHLWSLDAPAGDDLTAANLAESERRICHSTLLLIQALARSESAQPKLWLVTRGAQPAGEKLNHISIAQSSLCGMGRIIMNEHPELQCRLVDLDPATAGDSERLFDEVRFGDSEEEIAWRGKRRYVMRFVRGSTDDTRTGTRNVGVDSHPVRLETSRAGSLENLVFRELSRRSPAPREVEIEVDYAALNFRDVMKALGIYPGDAGDSAILGDECAGRIVAAGEEVTEFQTGDEVLAFAAGSFGSHVMAPMISVIRKPPHLDLEEAVTMPVAYMTAWYALVHQGRMRKGETILIHAATGGVGQAALHIAQLMNAEVFATAGSREKRAFLRCQGVQHVMDSRKLSFADEVMGITNGRGVDLVLNSLSGEAIPKSLSVLAPHGRFLEIGKRDIYSNTKIGLAPFRNNLSYFAIDLSQALNPSNVKRILGDLKSRFDAKKLPALPHRVFPFEAAHEAFRYMAEARQIGKVVLSIRKASVPVASHPTDGEIQFVADATYLIAGGLGGFGLALAEWLADHGARNIVLTSRSGPSSETEQIISRIKSKGARVLAAASDVSRPEDVEALMGDVAGKLPPLRGIFHVAMVLDDGFLVQLDSERFRNVTKPKIDGAWNLHFYTRHLPLDHFVLFSSISSIAGKPGQANYAAANAFLDALAHYRQLRGLPGLTINWGPISDTGYVARARNIEEHLARLGWDSVSPSDALSALGRLMMSKAAQKIIVRLDWKMWSKHAVRLAQTPRYSLLTPPETTGGISEESNRRFRDSILGVPAEERAKAIEEYVREQIAKVLRMPASRIDSNRPLNELGLDSLMSVELLHGIENQLGITIPTGQIMGAPTVSRLAAILHDRISSSATSEDRPPGRQPIQPSSKNEIDFNAEAQLDPTIGFDGTRVSAGRLAKPRAVLLFGAQSIIGRQLLHELLLQTEADIYCIVQHASVLRPQERVTPVIGNISRKRFGLDQNQFDSLAGRVDAIYHADADTNHVAPYTQLRSTNVTSVQEVIRLAAHERWKPVHYLSSLTVHFVPNQDTETVISENTALGSPELLPGAYAQTRWVAEQLLEKARASGIPVNIYRPGVLSGDSATGTADPDNAIWRFVKTCLALGMGPVTDAKVQLTPTDFAARSLVRISLQTDASGKNFHLVGPSHPTYTQLIELVNACGYRIRFADAREWEDRVINGPLDRQNHPLSGYLLFLPGTTIERLHFPDAIPRLDCSNAARALSGSGIECPPVDAALIKTHVDYFVRTGFFEAPL